MYIFLIQDLIDQSIFIIDASDRRDCIRAMVRTDEQWLRLVVGNGSDSHAAMHLIYISLKLCSERAVLNVVYRSVETVFFIVDHHAGSSGSQMRMIVCTEKQIKNAVFCLC